MVVLTTFLALFAFFMWVRAEWLAADKRQIKGDYAQEIERISREAETLPRLAARAFAVNKARGWWPDDVLRRTREHDATQLIAALGLVHSEVSEAIEDVRGDNFSVTYEESGKPVGFPTEMADNIIRTLNICHAMGIDIERHVVEKLDYNEKRAYRHGGKAL